MINGNAIQSHLKSNYSIHKHVFSNKFTNEKFAFCHTKTASFHELQQ